MDVGPALLIEYTAPAAVRRLDVGPARPATEAPHRRRRSDRASRVGARARRLQRGQPRRHRRRLGTGGDDRLCDLFHRQRQRHDWAAAPRPRRRRPRGRSDRARRARADGLLPLAANTGDVRLADATVAWWTPVVLLGVVTAGLPYVAGIAAGRRLGSRLVSFVSLLEVVAGVIFAWLLLDQVPEAMQLVGGASILLGVVVVRLGETASGTGDSRTRPTHGDLVPQPASGAFLQNP